MLNRFEHGKNKIQKRKRRAINSNKIFFYGGKFFLNIFITECHLQMVPFSFHPISLIKLSYSLFIFYYFYSFLRDR